MTPQRSSLRSGLSALTKSSLVVFGVPLALVRLWSLASDTSARTVLGDESTWIRVVLVLVGAFWVLATRALAVELWAAFAGRTAPARASWSTRWASGIAGLVIVVSATHVLGPNRSPQPRASVSSIHVPPVAPTLSGSDVIVVGPGECLADLARRHLGGREGWPELAAHNLNLLQANGERFVDPNLLRSGWCLGVPPGATVARKPDAPAVAQRRSRPLLDELALLGLGVLTTAALVRRLRTLRRAAESARSVGGRSRRHEPELEEIDTAIAPFGEAPLIDWIEVANRLLNKVASTAGVVPDVRLVAAGPGGIVILLAVGVECDADPFIVSARGRRWTLPLTASLTTLRRAAAPHARFVPWLIPIGDDGQDVWLLAVGPGRRLLLDGDPVRTRRVLGAMVTGLRTLPWADELAVELLGITPPGGEERCYQLAASSPEALQELATDPPVPRHKDPTLGWRREPLIILGQGTEEPEAVAAAAHLAGVIGVQHDGTERLVLDEDHARLEPYGLELRVPAPSEEAMALVDRLLDAAAATPSVVPIPPIGDLSNSAADEEPSSCLLELLSSGPRLVGVITPAATRDMSRVVELLAYLVLHHGQATETELRRALFPCGGSEAPDRLANLLAATKSVLQRHATSGSVPIALRAGRVELAASVGSDWVRLLAALARARHAGATEARDQLESLLDNEPRPPTRPYRWMESEGLVANLAFELCDAWHRLASLATANGEHVLADRAIRAGLAIEPASELLIRDLMILRGAERDRRGVLASYEQLELALAGIGGLEPSEETRRLLDELASGSR